MESITVRRANRHGVEDERALRERNSDPLGLESCAGYREVHSEA